MPSDSSETPTSAPEPNDEGSFETAAFTKQSTSRLLADRYRLIQPLGEGGMGTVWLAEQREPVKRSVAVKLIKAGLDNKAVVARFEAERQALAMMDHPNIAKILDGGLSESGAPYFVMELVKGTPLTEYCDAKKLNLSERLKLFVPVCQAIQHAHQKGIIHRDIKPSNILVAQYDDQAVPKVIDFGVAKATGGVLTEKTLNTGFGIVGTPQYMSPEQATLNQLDIDTRSDIYSLGVVLYELLTGTPPFKADELHQAGYMEILRVIREVEPPRPSTRVSTAEGLPQIAKTRNVEPTKLSVLLRTELDWVVMKALEKDRIRRYETASDFASDIERYLTGEPVQAHPPSRGYRLRKFLRKNRGPAIAVGVTSLALFAGVIGTTTAMLEANRQRSVAEGLQKRAEEGEKLANQRFSEVQEEKVKVERERKIAEVVKDFLLNKLLLQADPISRANAMRSEDGERVANSWNPTILELLDRASNELQPSQIETNFPNQPLLHAEILQTVGVAYQGVGEYDKAIEFLKRASELFNQHHGNVHVAYLKCQQQVAHSLNTAGKNQESLQLFQELLPLMKSNLGDSHPETLTCMLNLAGAKIDAGQNEEAAILLEQTLVRMKLHLGVDHIDTISCMNDLALAYQNSGRQNDAIVLVENTVTLARAKYGSSHPDTLTCTHNLADFYLKAGRIDESLVLLEEILNTGKAVDGPSHPRTLSTMFTLSRAYDSANRHEESIAMFEETIKLMESVLGKDHVDTLRAQNNLAVAYERSGRLDKAISLYEENIRLKNAKLGEEHPDTLITKSNLANVYRLSGKHDESCRLRRELVDIYRRQGESGRSQLSGQLAGLAFAATLKKDYSQAEQAIRECIEIRQADTPDAWNTFNAISILGGVLLGQQKFTEAEPLLIKGYEEMKARESTMTAIDREVRLREAIERLVALYTALGNTDEANKWQELLTTPN